MIGYMLDGKFILFESKFKCKKEIKHWTEIIETQGKRKKNKERVNAEKNLITKAQKQRRTMRQAHVLPSKG